MRIGLSALLLTPGAGGGGEVLSLTGHESQSFDYIRYLVVVRRPKFKGRRPIALKNSLCPFPTI